MKSVSSIVSRFTKMIKELDKSIEQHGIHINIKGETIKKLEGEIEQVHKKEIAFAKRVKAKVESFFE